MNLTDKLRHDFITRQIMAYAIFALTLTSARLFGAAVDPGRTARGQAVADESILPTPVPPKVPVALGFGKDGLAVVWNGKPLFSAGMPTVYRMEIFDNGRSVGPDYQWATKIERQSYSAERHAFQANCAWGEFSLGIKKTEPNRLDLEFNLVNRSDRSIAFVDLWLTPGFKFPRTPAGNAWTQGWPIFAGDGASPAVVLADFGEGALAVGLLNEPGDDALGYGHEQRLTLTVRKLAPHETRRHTLTLRLGAGSDSGADPYLLGLPIYRQFAKTHPAQGPAWRDRRPIAAMHPSSAERGLKTAKNPANPRGWIIGSGDKPVDITTDAGRGRFREQMLEFARQSVKVCKGMNAQGMICWSVEGQEYPHAISYLGSPDQVAVAAPEMDAVADDWFKIFQAAGLRTGVCLRPQQLILPKDAAGTAEQRCLWTGPNDESIDYDGILALLDRKLSYAQKRWGCTLFYVDSNVSEKWAQDPKTKEWKPSRWEVLSWKPFAELARRHTDCLIMPEHETFLYWSVTAPISVTPHDVELVWPEAFSIDLMQGFQASDTKGAAPRELEVKRGDILLFNGWYDSPENAIIRAIYERQHNPRWHPVTP